MTQTTGMSAQNFRFEPNINDQEWLHKTISELAEDGLLVTDCAFYKKRIRDGKTVIVCEKTMDTLFIENAYDIIAMEEEVTKMKIVSESIGIQFIDARAAKLN